MAALILPRRFHQPQGAVEVDWANPLALGLTFSASSVNRFRDVVNGSLPTQAVGSVSQSVTQYGISGSFSSSVIDYGARQLFPSTDNVTIQIIEIPNNLTQVAGIFDKRETASSQNSFSCGYNYSVGNEFSVDFGNASGVGGSSGVAYSFARSAFSTAGNNIVITLRGSASAGNKVRLWRNGAEVSQARAPLADDALTGIYAGTSKLEIGRVNNSTLYYAGKVVFVAAWNRALSDAEIRALSENPWQLFRAQPRRIFYSAAAGGVTGTATPTEAADTSSASGFPVTTGTVSKTQAADTSSASGYPVTTGTVAVTQGADTCSASGEVVGVVSGTVAATQAADTSSAAGFPVTTGTVSRTQAADTSSAAGSPIIVGTVAVTQGADTCAANDSQFVGTVAATESGDTASAAGSAGLWLRNARVTATWSRSARASTTWTTH